MSQSQFHIAQLCLIGNPHTYYKQQYICRLTATLWTPIILRSPLCQDCGGSYVIDFAQSIWNKSRAVNIAQKTFFSQFIFWHSCPNHFFFRVKLIICPTKLLKIFLCVCFFRGERSIVPTFWNILQEWNYTIQSKLNVLNIVVDTLMSSIFCRATWFEKVTSPGNICCLQTLCEPMG